MIQSFSDPATEDVYHGFTTARSRKFGSDMLAATGRKLDMLDAAATVQDLRTPPGNRLEKLAGNMKGLYSIRINDQWRIVFRWTPDGPAEVAIVDYH